MSSSAKFYLPQLDGLRFIAFFLVFIHHSLPSAVYFEEGSAAYWISFKLSAFGWIGVDIFLCLSSFLLTSLLIMEHKKTGTVSIKQFFVRRALRIWPLYYMVILLAFVVFPLFSFYSPSLHSSSYTNFLHQHLLPFSLFMGNFSYAYFTGSLTIPIAPLWTVSLEEQFYLFWPILLFILLPRSRKWFFIALAGMVLLSIFVRYYIIKNHIPYPAVWVFSLGRLDPFALGALVAYWYLDTKFKPRPVIACVLAIILFKLVVCSTGIGGPNTIWQLLFVDLASCLLIYSALYSSSLKKFLSMKPLPWLGKISFGLYVFHYLMLDVTNVHIMPFFIAKFHLVQSLGYWFFTGFIALSVTVLCATISYYAFEKHFLKLKTRFTVIASRPA